MIRFLIEDWKKIIKMFFILLIIYFFISVSDKGTFNTILITLVSGILFTKEIFKLNINYKKHKNKIERSVFLEKRLLCYKILSINIAISYSMRESPFLIKIFGNNWVISTIVLTGVMFALIGWIIDEIKFEDIIDKDILEKKEKNTDKFILKKRKNFRKLYTRKVVGRKIKGKNKYKNKTFL